MKVVLMHAHALVSFTCHMYVDRLMKLKASSSAAFNAHVVPMVIKLIVASKTDVALLVQSIKFWQSTSRQQKKFYSLAFN